MKRGKGLQDAINAGLPNKPNNKPGPFSDALNAFQTARPLLVLFNKKELREASNNIIHELVAGNDDLNAFNNFASYSGLSQNEIAEALIESGPYETTPPTVNALLDRLITPSQRARFIGQFVDYKPFVPLLTLEERHELAIEVNDMTLFESGAIARDNRKFICHHFLSGRDSSQDALDALFATFNMILPVLGPTIRAQRKEKTLEGIIFDKIIELDLSINKIWSTLETNNNEPNMDFIRESVKRRVPLPEPTPFVLAKYNSNDILIVIYDSQSI